jgi:hypothetical protein
MKALLTIILLATSITANAEFLNKAEREQISDYLDNICPDTYCGGDINWTSPKVVCGKKYCSVIIEAASYYSDDPFFTEEYFNNASADTKKGQGYKLFKAETFVDEWDDDQLNNTKVTAWCRLELPENISTMSYQDKEDAVYYANLDCVDKIEAGIYGL